MVDAKKIEPLNSHNLACTKDRFTNKDMKVNVTKCSHLINITLSDLIFERDKKQKMTVTFRKGSDWNMVFFFSIQFQFFFTNSIVTAQRTEIR